MNHTLSQREEALLDQLAVRSPFWGAIRAKYAEFGSLTDGQHECFERDVPRISWQRSAPRVAGVPVKNRFKAGKQPRCASRREFCREVATAVVAQFGYCAEHIAAAQADYDEWLAARRAERDQDAAAEAAGTS